MSIMITVERWWMRDMPNPPELAWRAVIGHPELGVVSAADATPWKAIARALAFYVLRQHGEDHPLQARQPLDHVLARAASLSEAASAQRLAVVRPQASLFPQPSTRPARKSRPRTRRGAAPHSSRGHSGWRNGR